MKTAISIPDEIFEGVTRAAEEENTSRSQIFTDAARTYLEQRKNKQLLSAINKAYPEEESKEEKQLRKYSKKYYARKVARGKW